MKYAIIAVGYNRPESIRKLIKSLCDAEYSGIDVDLIISLDYSDKQNEIIEISKSIKWQYGNKYINAYTEKQGLRKHILQCGDYTDHYDAVIVLEDDLIVSKSFMLYVDEVVRLYGEEQLIAGISLYTHHTNPGNGMFFDAQYNGYDVFLMQYAQSWGQCWTKSMWKGFRDWYEQADKNLCSDDKFPEYVCHWNSQSWLKYYIKYVTETGKFFVYPYFSHTTNSSATGEHSNHCSSSYEVQLVQGIVRNYRLPLLKDAIRYDAFFERLFSKEEIEQIAMGENILIDLYGLRTHFNNSDTLVSTKVRHYKIKQTISLKYRPIEQNIINQEPGYGIYVYDIRHTANDKIISNTGIIASYEFRAHSGKLIVKRAYDHIIEVIKARLHL